MTKNPLFFAILISFILFNIKSKKCLDNKCPDSETLKDIPKSEIKSSLKYYFANKNINFSQANTKLTLEFDGISQYESEDPNIDYTVTYIANFYDKESLGINNVQAKIQGIKPLYREHLVKFGEETKERINWEIEIKKNDEKIQLVQVIAQANYLGNTQEFCYNNFYFKYKVDRYLEFWIIFCGFVGIICLTFCCMFIYIIFAKKDERRPSIGITDLNSGLVDRESKENSRTSN
jgi:hypothetical protein